MFGKIIKLLKTILGVYNHGHNMWSKECATWTEAVIKSDKGYKAANILEKVSDALLKVKNGEAEYERDSCLFYSLDYNWSLIAIILKLNTSKKGVLRIVDFGGSLGSTYYQNRKMLQNIPLKWFIVEQSQYVDRGRELFETNELIFVNSISEIKEDPIDIILFSSVLQYLENPAKIIEDALQKNPTYIYIDRTSFVDSKEEIVAVQCAPAEIYEATYPCRFFVEMEFLKMMGENYLLISNLPNVVDVDVVSNNGKKLYFKGFIFMKKSAFDYYVDKNE